MVDDRAGGRTPKASHPKPDRHLIHRDSANSGDTELLVRAMRSASCALSVCANTFRKMEAGTDCTPIHVHRGDAERAERRAMEALAAFDRAEAARAAALNQPGASNAKHLDGQPADTEDRHNAARDSRKRRDGQR